MKNPIPKRLMDEFIGYCYSTYNNHSISDGTWFSMLANDADEFMKDHRLTGEPNDAVHQLLRQKATEKVKEELK